MLLQDKAFTTVIQSSRLSEIPLHTVLFNVADFSDIICVKLPPDLPRELVLAEIYNLDSSEDIDFEDKVSRNENRPWIDIDRTILDTSIGQHTYRMTFRNENSKLSAACWFSYIIQNNNPEKPYIYMKRDEDSGESGSSES